MKILATTLMILILASPSNKKDPTDEKPFLFVGHRGASYLAPENTLASLKLAWELGAEAAECSPCRR